VTPEEASQLPLAPPKHGATLAAMTYAVALRFGPAGTHVHILHDNSEPLPGGNVVRYRLEAQTDDHGEAVKVVEPLNRRLRE
jgi:hypothetical protein